MRFFPSTMTVHKGDTITFSGGFHTATLLPAGDDPNVWVEDNATALGAPYGAFTADPDEGPAAIKFNNAVAFGDPTCGTADAPCDYTGNDVVNSGVFVFGPGSFTATINANPGDILYVICLIHPNMRMRVTVVAPTDAATTQGSIDEAMADTVAQDNDDALAIHSALKAKRSKHTTTGGKTVWDTWVGYDTPHVSLLGMYPKKLSIKKGQTVRYHFQQLVYEIHTATFPLADALAISNNSFVPVCDPDGDSGTMPDNPPEMQAPPFCNDPTQLELDIDAGMLDSGDQVLRSRNDFENSTPRGPSTPAIGSKIGGQKSWDLKFQAVSPTKGFKYICMIHPSMRGAVVVK